MHADKPWKIKKLQFRLASKTIYGNRYRLPNIDISTYTNEEDTPNHIGSEN